MSLLGEVGQQVGPFLAPSKARFRLCYQVWSPSRSEASSTEPGIRPEYCWERAPKQTNIKIVPVNLDFADSPSNLLALGWEEN